MSMFNLDQPDHSARDAAPNPFSALSGSVHNPTYGNVIHPIPDPAELRNLPGRIDTPTGKPIIDLSHSSVNDIHGCPRRYQLRKNFYSPDYSGFNEFLAAASGTAIHEYIQSRLRGETHDQATYAFFRAYSFLAEDDANDNNRLHRSLEPAYHTACETWNKLDIHPSQIAQFTVDDSSPIPGTEFKFAIALRHSRWNNTYIYRGAIDICYTITDSTTRTPIYCAADIKTNRDFIEDATPKFRYDTQLTPYGLILAHLTGTPISSFEVTYYSIFVDAIEPRVTPYLFTRTEEDTSAWLQNTLRHITQLETYTNQTTWPRCTNGCISFNKPCRFFDLCHLTSHTEIQSAILRDGAYAAKAPSTLTPHVTIDLNLEDQI